MTLKEMTGVVLNLADGRLEVELSLFISRPSCVVMLMWESFGEEGGGVEVELLDLTLDDFQALRCMLEGKILATYLPPDLLEKAGRYGFTRDTLHYLREHKKQKALERTRRLDAFLEGQGNDLLLLSRSDYEVLKPTLSPNIVPVVVLMESDSHVVGVVAHDIVPLKVYHTYTEPVIENFNLTRLIFQSCFTGLRCLQDYPDPYPDAKIEFDLPLDPLKDLGSVWDFRESVMKYCHLIPSAVNSDNPDYFLKGLILTSKMLEYLLEAGDVGEQYGPSCSIYHRAYESYYDRPTSLVYPGRIEAVKVLEAVDRNLEALGQEARKRHRKAQILSVLAPTIEGEEDQESYHDIYTACYGLVRL